MRKIIFSLLFSLFLTPTAQGQNGRIFDSDKELSNNLVNRIVQDKRGYVWICTENGLNKTDGMKVVTYRHRKDDPHSLVNDYVHTFYCDSRGRNWVGCINGVMLYNEETDDFTEIPLVVDDVQQYSRITSFMELKSGPLVITTSGSGIFVLDDQQQRFVPFPTNKQLQDICYFDNGLEDTFGNLWFMPVKGGLVRYEQRTQTFKSYWEDMGSALPVVSASVVDKTGTLYLGLQTKGIVSYNPRTDEFTKIVQSTPTDVRSLLFDASGELLVGLDGDGLMRYDAAKGRLTPYASNTFFSLHTAKIHNIMTDSDGNLWLAMYQRGAAIIPSEGAQFRYLGYKSPLRDKIGNNCVMSLFVTSDNKLWLGADNDGLYCVDLLNETSRHFPPSQHVPRTVMSLYEDKRGSLWAGTYNEGLMRINPSSGRGERVRGIDEKHIYALLEDSEGNILVGSHGGGLFRVDNGYPLVATAVTQGKEYLTNPWINCMARARNGLVWIGTYRGVTCYDPQAQCFVQTGLMNSVVSDLAVYSIIELQNGEIAIGASNGIYFFDPLKRSFRVLTSKEGLADNTVYILTEDYQGKLWAATSYGLSAISTNGEIVNYYKSDGLQGNEFSRGAGCLTRSGRLFLGGTNGITFFEPERTNPFGHELQVRITGFTLNNQSANSGGRRDNRTIMNKTLIESTRFVLSHRDNSFGFDFSVFDFVNPSRYTYQFKLHEAGSKWTNIPPGSNSALFAGLSPGTYTLCVQVMSNNRIVASERRFTIIITPPWYASWWAYVLYFLLLGVVVYIILLQVHNRIQERQESLNNLRLSQLNESKLQFFINVSHEIRTPMSLIVAPLEKLMRSNPYAELNKPYQVMYSNAQRILRLINQLMDIRKLDKGMMVLRFSRTLITPFIHEIVGTFDYQLQKKNIHLNIYSSVPDQEVWIDVNNFDKVIINMLYNAVKYTPENGAIDLFIDRIGEDEEGELRIIMQDNGVGVDPNQMERIFERFYQINSEVNQSTFGTGIGLHLSRQLIELHSGSIHAQVRQDGLAGGCFVITLPLGSAHLRSDEMVEQGENTSTQSLLHTSEPIVNDAPDVAEEKRKAVRTKRLLIVDDEEDIRNYLSDEFTPSYNVAQAPNGKVALDMLLHQHFDLVILDVMMPEMDGITLCARIRQNIHLNHIPVVLLTAKSAIDSRIEGVDTGADAYLVKPFNLELLRSTVTNLLATHDRLKVKFSGQQDQADKVEPIALTSADEQFLARIMKVINANLNDSDLTIEAIADKIGMSRVHVNRKLKALTNQSTRDFVRNVRLKQAAKLLSEKKHSVADVAYATGFSNLSHFSTAFKDLYGVSPKEWAARNREE